jgi:hypothetical protein
MDLQAVTGQLYLVNGALVEADVFPGLLAQAPPPRAARGRDRDHLFVHLTLSGPAEETAVLAQDLLDAISQRFYGTPGSVTAALRQAIVETNDLLLRRNVSGADASREGAVSCAVMRGQELYMAQVGESFAALGQNYGLERLPAAPPAVITPMGRTAGLDVRFYHNWLEPGNMLLLADPRMGHLPPEAIRAALTETVNLDESLATFESLLTADTARLLVILFTDQEVLAMPSRGPLRGSGATLAPPTAPPRRERKTTEEAIESPPVRTRPELELDVAPVARDASAQAARSLGKLTGATADILGRLKPPDEHPTESESEPNRIALPALLAIVIPLIIALVGTTVYLQRGEVERFSRLRQEMNQALGFAQQTDDEAARTTFYQQALAIGVEAEALRPGNGDIASMRRTALEALDRLEGITRLEARTLYMFDQGANLRSLALREGFNGDLFVLDTGNNAVWLHETEEDYMTPVSESAEQILTPNQAIGSHTVGTLLDMVWREPGANVSRENLAVVDAQGALISFYPDFRDYRAVPLGLASGWRAPRQITEFAERLYVLDTGEGVIWRYFPDGEGFTIAENQQTLSFSDDADLANAVDMAIYSEDGSVFLLYSDGRLRRYVSGRPLWTEADLAQGGLPSPLVAPTALKLVGRGLNSSLFVVDPGSSRVVQFSVGGVFLAQYKAAGADGSEAFASASDIAIAETPLRIFVIGGNRLTVATER